MASRAVIVGCGDVGGRLAQRLLARQWQVFGLRRDVARLPAGVIGLAADLRDAACPGQWPSGKLDYLVYCVAASQHDEAGYRQAYVDGLRHVLGWLEQNAQAPRRILFVSSSSVYGQADGEWVDEVSPTQVSGFSGRLMLEAEQSLLTSGFAGTVVRLTGIYGPGRARLVDQVRQGYRVAQQPPLYGNRIHVDDAAGLLEFLLLADQQGTPLEECYIGVDDDPAPLFEVVAWLREYLGVTGWSATESVRRTGSKRCRNARARALGWAPEYASFREGYAAML
ncbi:SDR family oxidoreductase [Pseudomonas sp. HR96]|uniref:SDR family oxidoreductase n=1 Tax=Pseudomonas sp. HR96 TaxID=1027966 RepID=UPI002A7552B7|nr:SDR family oxidoreductase [Pseudomonas sp. HR96]WPO99850.1 SDR family oxidoreductase [Pseudomonas sp. HR96]